MIASPGAPPRRWQVRVAEGHRYDEMVRAAAFVLALAERAPVQVRFAVDEAVAPWRHLLSGPQQLRLRELALPDHESARLEYLIGQAEALREGPQDTASLHRAGAELAALEAQILWCQPGTWLPAAAPGPEPDWLLLTSPPPSGAATRLALGSYARTFACSPGPVTALPGYLPLPMAVDVEHFHPGAAAPTPRLLIVGGPEAPPACALAHWALALGAAPILFDPYFSAAHYRACGLPAAVDYAGAGSAAYRAQIYAVASAVVAADAAQLDDHFVWEAAASGRPQLLPPATGWDAEALAAAWTAPPEPPEPALFRSWDSWTATVCAAPPVAPQTPAQIFQVGPHQIILAASPAAAAAATIAVPAAAPILILRPAATADWQADWRPLWWNAAAIWVDTADNARFVVDLVAAMLPPPLQICADFADHLCTLLAPPAPVQVQVIHLAASAASVAASAQFIAGLAELAGGERLRLPRIVLHAMKRFGRDGASHEAIGVAVATQATVTGLMQAAAGRCRLRWLGRQRPDSARGRIYLYPHALETGLENDELDYAALPTALAGGQVDLLCCLDPFLVAGTSARALWARRPLPLVGMLHSIHTALGCTEVQLQLLSGPSYAYDAIIAPSQAGRTAYAGLLAASHAWLTAQGAQVPPYQGRLEVIPYGIEGRQLHGLCRAACRLAQDLPIGPVTLLCLGRLSRQEKADLLPLLLALRALHQAGHQVRLVLAGSSCDGSYLEPLHKMIAALQLTDWVDFRLDLSSADKRLLYGAADIFVALSDNVQETFGLAVLEAMAAGLPVVAASWDGFRELVQHDETGLLVPTAWSPPSQDGAHLQRIAEGIAGYGHRDLHETVALEPERLAQALTQLVTHRDRRLDMGAAGQRRQAEDFEQAIQGQRTLDLLLELAAQARQSSWTPPPAPGPFSDPLGARFGHYPSQLVGPETRLLRSNSCDDLAWTGDVQRAMALPSRRELALHAALIKAVPSGPEGIQVAELEAELGAAHPEVPLRPRILRAIKYGWLRLAPP